MQRESKNQSRSTVTRRRAPAGALEKDLTFRTLFEKSGDANLLVSDGVIVDCNAVALTILGAETKADVIGKRFEDVSPELQPDGIRSHSKARHMAALALENGTHRFEWAHKRLNGEEFDVEVMLTSIPFEGKSIFFTTWRDISQRKQALKALAENEERYRSLVKQSSDGVFIADPRTGKIQEVNDRFLGMFGYREEEVASLSIYDIVADEKGSVEANINRLVEQGEYTLGQRNYKRKDGSVLHVEVRASVIRCGDQDVIMANVRDVTERRRSAAALKASEERYRLLVEGSSDAILMLDNDRRIVSCNPAFLRLFGYEKGEIENAPVRILHPSDESYRTFGKLAYPAIQKENAFRTEWNFRRKDGKAFPSETVTSRLIGHDGTVSGFVAVIRDISERKRSDDRIKYLTFHDKLTGLYNRAYFEEELKRLDVARQLPLSIVMGDANGLKIFNDVFGHKEGDRLLKHVASILKASCRKEDMVARWGGDEFVILLPRTDGKSATVVTQRIRQSCASTDINILRPSISLGVATKETMEQNLQKVLKEAEDRMYTNKLLETTSARSAIIVSLQKTLQEKSHETEEHAKRLQKMALRIGSAIGLTDSQLDELVLLAALHDIGKIAISDEILNKPGSLNDHEWEVMQKHCEVGFRIAQTTPELSQIGESILQHHERWDGRGYPLGHKGEEIPLVSRILAIVDSFDVMTQDRPYRRAMPREAALEELNRCSGTQFDPRLVDLFLSFERTSTEDAGVENAMPLSQLS